jgi:hypothetical protein
MSTTAPSFDAARMELYGQLAHFSFVRVVRPCVVPDDPRGNPREPGGIPYFHGTGSLIADQGQGSKVWFKKMQRELADEAFTLGPLTVKALVDMMPRVGDVLMGRVTPSPKGSDKLLLYFAPANHVHLLMDLVLRGTSKSEMQLQHELRAKHPVNGGVDDAFGIARLILFGNVRAFAEQHTGAGSPTTHPMRLSCSPLLFVHKCAVDFQDPTIWSSFVALVPDAQPPPPPLPPTPPPPLSPPQPTVAPLNLAALPPPLLHASHQPSFVGRQRRPPPVCTQRSYGTYEPVSPPYRPASPPYVPYEPPPASPPFRARTPPSPQSPVYHPTTPPRAQRAQCDTSYDRPGAYSPPLPMTPPPPLSSTNSTQQRYTVESVLSLLQSVAAVQQR